MIAYNATTDDVTVTVRPLYLDAPSDFFSRRFVFAYFVRIANRGTEELQLLRRRWIIRESAGPVREVEGEGIVGMKPVILPGTSHDYNSYSVIHTHAGSMEGWYLMQRENGDRFKASIPRFDLRVAAN